ncbi:hypothetical protein LTR84_009900 [Exophiala bonariae]|uniref:Elongator complex protein 5 n=1 Tax=Exophiala bonariae TaxID=1690606 RepID=A0AAV9NNC5_9EURO|nr:hypothetical protein LTR84_009900 [Exophiala bonariae]
MNTVAIKYTYVLDLLKDLIRNHSSVSPQAVNLVICSTRDDFLGQVLSSLHPPLQPGIATNATLEARHHDEIEHGAEGPDEDDYGSSRSSHQLFLSPVLSLLSASQSVKLIFCPTIPTLRAYFSSLYEVDGNGDGDMAAPEDSSSTSKSSQIIVLNMLAQHHGSSEFTLQGLSQTLATIVSAGARTSQAVRLVECKDANDPSNDQFGSNLWDMEVPLLSLSIKIGEGGARWGRRTVQVKKIASRWFRREMTMDQRHVSRTSGRQEIPDSEDEMLL